MAGGPRLVGHYQQKVMSWKEIFIPSAKEADAALVVSTEKGYINFNKAAMHQLGIQGGGYVKFFHNSDTKLYYVGASNRPDGIKIGKSGKRNSKLTAEYIMKDNPSFLKIKDGHYRLMLSRKPTKTNNGVEVYALAKETL